MWSKLMKNKYLLLIMSGYLFSTSSIAASSAADCGTEAKACTQYGAVVFQERCALCHGSDGLGEGVLSLGLKNYPNTNLLKDSRTLGHDSIVEVITHGGTLPNVSAEMPPWGDELTVTETESVALFIGLLRSDLESALKQLKATAKVIAPDMKLGKGVFKGRCSLCHGKEGKGDGKMARIIKNPPPFNLTKSGVPDDYLFDIISKGGQGMGRSARMPPFGGDLSDNEIRSIMLFIKSIRN